MLCGRKSARVPGQNETHGNRKLDLHGSREESSRGTP